MNSDTVMAKRQLEKEESVNFDYLRNINVNVRRPDSVSAKDVNLGGIKITIKTCVLVLHTTAGEVFFICHNLS